MGSCGRGGVRGWALGQPRLTKKTFGLSESDRYLSLNSSLMTEVFITAELKKLLFIIEIKNTLEFLKGLIAKAMLKLKLQVKFYNFHQSI